MRPMTRQVFAKIFATCLCFGAHSSRPPLKAPIESAYPFRNAGLPMEQRITDLLSHMTLEEKIACLGTKTAVPRLGVKSFGSSEGIHGVVQRGEYSGPPIETTQFPQPPGMGETWDPELVKQAGGPSRATRLAIITQTAKYNRQILMLWGPQSDLARDPRWGRTEEVYGEDPFLNGTMATAFIHGLQGDDPKYWLSAALLKHFLANSNEDFRTSSSSDFDQRLFWEYYSVPFRMGFLDGGAKAVMASYNAWNGTPMVVNPILKSILQKQWGVDVLSSDGGAVKLLVNPRHAFPDQKSGCRRKPQGRHQSVPRYLPGRDQGRRQGRSDLRGARSMICSAPSFASPSGLACSIPTTSCLTRRSKTHRSRGLPKSIRRSRRRWLWSQSCPAQK